MPRSSGPWASATDLAEYAYCPRAWYYRHHPPPEGSDAVSERRSAIGEEYHRITLREEERLERAAPAYAALLVGFLLLLAVGVGAWILFH